MKAVKITTVNQSMLAQRFNVDPDDMQDRLPAGYWLVTEFGNDEYFDIINEATYISLFDQGQALDNGFYEITRK